MKKCNVSYDENSVFRLRILHFGTIPSTGSKEIVDWPRTPFLLPDNMSVEEGFLVLSYLTQKIEQDLRLPKCSARGITILNENLAKFHFRSLPLYEKVIVDLITATGDMKRFKHSEYYSSYFDWFTEGVTYQTAKEIYQKYGYDFEEPSFDKFYKYFPQYM